MSVWHRYFSATCIAHTLPRYSIESIHAVNTHAHITHTRTSSVRDVVCVCGFRSCCMGRDMYVFSPVLCIFVGMLVEGIVNNLLVKAR